MKHLVVLTAGLSTPSTTRRVADEIAGAVIAEVPALDVTTIELKDFAHDLADAMVAGVMSAQLADAIELVSRADGLVVVTPVFKASYSGLFKMFFDVLDSDALRGTPTIIAATAGSQRHTLVADHALRPLLSYMHAIVVPTSLFATAEDVGTGGATAFSGRVRQAAVELASLLQRRGPRLSRSSGPISGAVRSVGSVR
ncbi:NAD(P)H-dependent FAD/FMN reductase [Corynebacterium capitovis DSM 44611]|uniref:CE1759 family FMN reductase n=1 Tax=Corynebacterium capitovis TaxID=131081 RepID=UPI00037E35F1|nr:CE1759 family FMN reductase [Corynebacterium capitovis]WKD57570.1 NAD(P)H-dependent FAD/FMN reductase [Corynebacterium capitovis DSM 44611]